MTEGAPVRRVANSIARACGGALLLVIFLVAGCKSLDSERNPQAQEILVSAAVSLKEAFAEISRSYEAKNGIRVVFIFGGSGELARQIEFGAPADVFASAGEREMDQLAAKGVVELQSRADFAENTLVLIVPAATDSPAASLSDLAQPKFKMIAIGNPQTVPAGHYAEEALKNNRLSDVVGRRLIMAENVRQVLEYVASGEVDAGLVYSTDLSVAGGRVKVLAVVPQGTYGPIRYPIAIVKDSAHHDAARKFLEMVLGSDGQLVLQKHGFAPVR